MSMRRIIQIAIYVLLFLNLFFLSALVSFQITLRGETVLLPDLVGKTVEEARAQLSEKKLFLVQEGVRLDQRFERGRIIFQQPAPDKRAKINSEVRVLVSAGKEKVVVPDLIGRNLQTIGGLLEQAGLRKGKISHVHTTRYAAGKIIAQSPLPMGEVGRDTPVSLLVSQGAYEKRYMMPDLIGRSALRVIAQLKQMGFNIGNIRYRAYRGLGSGIIINQTPAPGSKIQRRNRITLEVSK